MVDTHLVAFEILDCSLVAERLRHACGTSRDCDAFPSWGSSFASRACIALRATCGSLSVPLPSHSNGGLCFLDIGELGSPHGRCGFLAFGNVATGLCVEAITRQT